MNTRIHDPLRLHQPLDQQMELLHEELHTDLPELFMSWSQKLRQRYQDGVRGVRTLFFGHPTQAVVRLNQMQLEVYLASFRREPNTGRQRLQVELQGTIPLEPGHFHALEELLSVTLQMARRDFHECSRCGHNLPLEILGHLDEEPTCVSCIEQATVRY